MNLYLVQHGEALAKEIDPVRPLSEKGRQDVAKVGSFVAANCHVRVSHLYHSGKLRARQTAEILAECLDLSPPIQSDGLAPMDDPAIWANRCEELTKNIMLVGHLPHLVRLAGALLRCGAESPSIAFRMGGMVALQREEGRWALQWMIVPEILSDGT